MIFAAIALLVVAAIALGVGIAASAVGPLVVSVLTTLAAGGVLWASFIRYRKEAAEEGFAVTGLGGNEPLRPGYPGAYAQPYMAGAPVAGAPGPVPAAEQSPAMSTNGRAATVPSGWDDMAEEDAVAAVEAFNLDELHELRRHEVEHARRGEALARIDQRIDTLVALRRKLTSN